MVTCARHVWLWLWLELALVLAPGGVESQRIFREDRLALLSGTLRTFQVASCDGEHMRLQCPAGTTISIKLVQYGRLASKPDICGHPSDMQRFNSTDCLDRNALKVVIAACGGRSSCQLYTSPTTFGVDPCPHVRKFVEVLYKCRPSEFRNKVVCQGQRKTIYCGQDGVAIYSATFGTRKRGSVHCPQPPGVRLTDCQESFTSEKMISRCQGKSSCDLHANPDIHNRACPRDHNMYLTTTYTCVPHEILKEQYAREVDEDYQQNMTEAPPVLQEEAAEMESRDVPPSDEMGQERLILYLILGVTGCLLLVLGAVFGRLCCRRRGQREVKDAQSEPTPPGFTPDLSRTEADLDLAPTLLSSGRLTPPYASQRSFSPPLRPPAQGAGRSPSPGREGSLAYQPTYRDGAADRHASPCRDGSACFRPASRASPLRFQSVFRDSRDGRERSATPRSPVAAAPSAFYCS